LVIVQNKERIPWTNGKLQNATEFSRTVSSMANTTAQRAVLSVDEDLAASDHITERELPSAQTSQSAISSGRIWSN